MLSASAMSMILCLAKGIAIRGGIEIGAALDMPDFGIYGSAYYAAYKLESKVAKHPRIVLGDELITYLDIWRSNNGNDPETNSNKKLADICSRVIYKDLDGRPILDFLSPDLLSMFNPHIDKKTLVTIEQERDKSFKFVQKELERLRTNQDSENPELAFYYAHLMDYYSSKSK